MGDIVDDEEDEMLDEDEIRERNADMLKELKQKIMDEEDEEELYGFNQRETE